MSDSNNLMLLLFLTISFLITASIMDLLDMEFLIVVTKFFVLWWFVLCLVLLSVLIIMTGIDKAGIGLDSWLWVKTTRNSNDRMRNEIHGLERKIRELEKEIKCPKNE